MPVWLIELLISLALKFGLPYLIKAFPSLPKEVWEVVETILKAVQSAENPQDKAKEIRTAVNQCTGVGCPPETKGT